MQSKIILLVGFQASTKSTAAQEILSNVPNAVILSRDTEGGTVEALVAKAENHIKDGKVVVIDNTNLTKHIRKLFIDLAMCHNIPVDAHYFNTTLEDCQARHLRRMYEKYGEIYQTGTQDKGKKSPHCFGPVVLFKARKDFERPTREEGLSCIINHPVPAPTWDPAIYKNKALFLDIDGTLRETEHLPNKYPTHPDEVQLILPADQMYAKLNGYRARGYQLIGVSNQSGIAKGTVTQAQVDAIFDKTRQLIGFTENEFPILYCPHPANPVTCFCRKPGPGMGMEAIMKLKLNPVECEMVGDMKTDEEFARRLQIKYWDVKDFWA
jgi:histidinol-phosphate phosphatase family protein